LWLLMEEPNRAGGTIKPGLRQVLDQFCRPARRFRQNAERQMTLTF
jgi:hypothetical protein